MQRKANLMEKAFTTFKIHADMMKALKEKERKAENKLIPERQLNIKVIFDLEILRKTFLDNRR